jgi:hypothetical protein
MSMLLPSGWIDFIFNAIVKQSIEVVFSAFFPSLQG